MPKKDPGTGCTVITTQEFFQGEAKQEGKGRSGAELMIEMFDEIEASARAEENNWKTNPTELLQKLQQEIKEYNEADPEAEQYPIPTQILEVIEVKINYGMRTNSFYIRCRCIKEDGSTSILNVNTRSHSGSMYEPPDYDCEIKWEV